MGRSQTAVPADSQAELNLAELPRQGGTPPNPRTEGARRTRLYVTAACMLVSALGAMETTITSTVMPTIIGELNGVEHYSWVASMYLLALSVSMPFYGRLADAIGRKKVLLSAIFIFMIASVLAAMSRSMTQLIIFRALQGLGAGGILPVVNTVLGDIFNLEERGKIQGLFSTIWGASSLAGPILGAFLVKTFGWRSAFFVNLPLGAMAFVVLTWKYHDPPTLKAAGGSESHSPDLDLPGILLLMVASSALLLLVSGLAPGDWIGIAVLAALTLVSTVWLIRHERRTRNPILPADFLTNPLIGPSLLGGAMLGVAILGIDTYVPLYVQGARGGGVGAAAGVVTPVMMMWAISSFFAGRFVVNWGFRKTAFIGALIILAGLAGVLACAMTGAGALWMTLSLAATGAGFGPSSLTFLLAPQGAVNWQRRGIVTSSVQFFRTVGGSIGIGLLGTIFTLLLSPHLPQLQKLGVSPSQLLGADAPARHGASAAALPQAAVELGRQVIARGSIWIFVAMLLFALAQVVLSAMIPASSTDHAVSSTEMMEAMTT